ncbi:ROK family transcriptional regulator [Alloacidobacterium dinghuense]|uniref:ROK family transcriptional regulator n=1 Tax=Alloacidobacterium dinghuense TaxID=2763107 RepID=A0A7G8BR56_9BACT|nr:ROK family transcriptional regulator [Alloacidobacterium dinghuense]
MSNPGPSAKAVRRVDLNAIELASSETARRINREIILQLIHSSQPISRADLARLSGLQRSTVSQIIEQLIQERWIREGAVAQSPRGRRPTMLLLNDELVVLAADIHPRQVTVAMIDLTGRLLSRSTLPLGSDPARSVAGIIDCMKRIRDSHPRKSLEGIGISVPGRVDTESQLLIFAPNLHWPKYDIKGAVERGMELPTEMENAATACLMSELWFGRMDGVRDAVLITVSEGIGGGILANGQLVTGQNGMAGEFGHIAIDPSGPRCACTQNGCWEVFGSCNAGLRYYYQSDPKAKRITFQELLNFAEEGNAHAVAALAKQAKYIGQGLRMVTAALSPELVLIAGDITSAWHRFSPIIEAELEKSTLKGEPPRLLATHEGDVARLRGAAALLLQRHSIRSNE